MFIPEIFIHFYLLCCEVRITCFILIYIFLPLTTDCTNTKHISLCIVLCKTVHVTYLILPNNMYDICAADITKSTQMEKKYNQITFPQKDSYSSVFIIKTRYRVVSNFIVILRSYEPAIKFIHNASNVLS